MPPAITVRVCDGLSCEMAGAQDLLARLPGLLGPGVRVLAAPCIGRCEQAPAAVVGQIPVAPADLRNRRGGRRGEADAPRAGGIHRPRRLQERGRLHAAAPVHRRRARRRRRHQDARGVGPARPRRRRLSGRPQVADRARRAGAAADGRQHRRRRAGHVQGPRLPRARSAPLHRRHADRGVGGRHLEDLRLPARRVSRLPRAARVRAGKAARRAAVPRHAGDRAAPRRRRIHLRRRVGDDRIDRRQARHAATAAAVCRPGRPVRPADARAQLRDAVLGARAAREGRRVVRLARPQRSQGPALVLGLAAACANPASSSRPPASRSRS